MQSCEVSWVLCLPQSKASRREDEAGEDVAESRRATGLWRAPQISGRKDGHVRCICVCVMGVHVWAVSVCMSVCVYGGFPSFPWASSQLPGREGIPAQPASSGSPSTRLLPWAPAESPWALLEDRCVSQALPYLNPTARAQARNPVSCADCPICPCICLG